LVLSVEVTADEDADGAEVGAGAFLGVEEDFLLWLFVFCAKTQINK
jgi:hypothetical protein